MKGEGGFFLVGIYITSNFDSDTTEIFRNAHSIQHKKLCGIGQDRMLGSWFPVQKF